jgi:hypothetical protein
MLLKRIPNAEKWTEMYTLTHLHDIRRRAQDTTTLYLGRALAGMGLYAHVWCYWRRKWRDHDTIMDMMYHIEALFEAKLYEAALSRQVSPSIAMLGLRRNHGWAPDQPGYSDEPAVPATDGGMYIKLGDRLVISGNEAAGSYIREQDPPQVQALMTEPTQATAQCSLQQSQQSAEQTTQADPTVSLSNSTTSQAPLDSPYRPPVLRPNPDITYQTFEGEDGKNQMNKVDGS